VDFGGVLEKQTRDAERAGRWFGLALAVMLFVTTALVAAWVFRILAGEELAPSESSLPTLLFSLGASEFAQMSGVAASLSTWLGAKAWSAHRQTTVLLIARVLDLEGQRDAAIQLLFNRPGRGSNIIDMAMNVFN
jgi:hypothetical protein